MPPKARGKGNARGRGNGLPASKAIGLRGRASGSMALSLRKRPAAAPVAVAGTAATASASSASTPPRAATPKAAPKLQFDAKKVALEVLRLAETGQHQAILRVLGDDVGPSTGAVAARKAFLRISMLIHPDKLPGLPEATKAFQALVLAFDETQSGGTPAAAGKPKHATLQRSNEGCFKTEILCPRCEGPWGKRIEGNPDYFYNFMMEGLKRFTCSTCLLKFGCLTARHICPFCKGTFEYYPDQYHHKVTCGNPGCNQRFGFMNFHISERALNAAREQIRAEFEEESRRRENKAERAKRLERRLGKYDDVKHEESLFTLGLRDTCPRCGLDLSEEGDDAQVRHLRNCNGTQQKRLAVAKATAEKKSMAQHQAAASAVFTFCGGGAGQLWMLGTEQLKRLCNKEGLQPKGGRDEMIGRLAEHYAKTRGDVPALKDLPRNLHSLSDDKLSAVCAAYRMKGLESRDERLEALEELAIEEAQQAPKAVKGQDPVFAVKDKNYLRKQGKRVFTEQAAPKAPAKTGKHAPAKRRRVADD